MRRIICRLIFLLFLTSLMNLHAQWARTYGTFIQEYAYSIQQTSDGGYIVAGNVFTEALVTKLFPTGAIEWQRSFGSGFPNQYIIKCVQQTSDGGYIAAGYIETPTEWPDVWVLKLTATGDIEWQKKYGGSDHDYAYSIQQTTDGGYVVAGYTQSFFAAGFPDVWVLKLTSTGDIVWQKTYGYYIHDYAYSIQQTSDGGYVVAGSHEPGGGINYDLLVLKLTSSGAIEWQKTYGWSAADYAHSIKQTSDGGYIVAGYTKPSGSENRDVWILKLTSSGAVEWQKTYGGSSVDDAYSIQQTSDGGYVVAGYTKSFGAGIEDAWVLKLASTGAVEWEKAYGGIDKDYAYSIQQTSDSGYVVAGYTESFEVDGPDILVLKLDSNGDIPPSCGLIATSNATITQTSASVSTPQLSVQSSDCLPLDSIACAIDTDATTKILCGSPELLLKISSGHGGTTDPSPGYYFYNSGTQVGITALPVLGYSFAQWNGDYPSGHRSDNPLAMTMNSEKSISAAFSLAPGYYELTINKTLGGITDPAPGIYTHSAGTEACVTAVPDAGKSFLYWSGDVPVGHESDNPLYITMDSKKTLTPHFRFPEKLWTVMVYLDGDIAMGNQYMPERYAIDDFLEMAMAGSDANVNIVVQFDRNEGGDIQYGDWSSTKRFYVTSGLAPTPENAIEDLGELNMGDPQTLANFIYWAKASFPADNYALILWNKGGGWYGLCEDSTSSGDSLSIDELQSALSSSGGAHLVGFDASLMGMVEVAYEIRNNGQVMVGSEHLVFDSGWPYTTILQDLIANPSWSASELGTAIVNRYYEFYYDTDAGSEQALSAVDLKNISALAESISSFAQTMIDSWNTNPTAVKNQAQSVMAEIDKTVIHEKHGPWWPGTHGLAIYFPEILDEFDPNYSGTNLDFLANTQWEEFLQEFLSSMAASWIAQRRAGTQDFALPQNIDLYHFCEMLNIVQGDFYSQSLTPNQWTGGGTRKYCNDDDRFLFYTLPFDFPYFDQVIPAGTTLNICTNGFVNFYSSSSKDYINSGWELVKAKRIAPCWLDLTTAGSAQAGEDIYITEKTDSLIIRWVAETVFIESPVNIELILYKDGRIQFNYGEGNANLYHWYNAQGPTIGISNGDGNNFYFSAHNVKKILTNAESVIFTATNPTPSLTSLVPSSAIAGSPAFTLAVIGSRFANGAVVSWDGSDRSTTFVNSNEVDASITANDILTAKTVSITVRNPDGRTSGALNFSVTNPPAPVLTSISPPGATGGGAAFTITVNGSNFMSGSEVRWNGSSRTTTYVSSSVLQAAIPAGDIGVGGDFQVTVTNPVPAGSTSNALTFSVSSFNLSSSPSSATVNAGQTATYTIQITPNHGSFDSSISFRSTGLPSYTSALIVPSTVSPGLNSASATLTITTTSSSASTLGAVLKIGDGIPPAFLLLPALLGFSTLLGTRRRSLRSLRRLLTAAGLVFMIIIGGSCSSGAPEPPPDNHRTPAGTYQITVEGKSGTLKNSTAVTLTVR